MNSHDSEPLPAGFNKEKLADYLRGMALRIAFHLPETENKDPFDWYAETVEAYLKEQGII